MTETDETWVASNVWRETPPASSPEARRRMQATKGRDSRPEVTLRKLLHARGLRFRVHALVLPSLRRRADVVFIAARVAVYVDGCFWHGCPDHVVWPRTNVEWWKKKIASTKRRDLDTDRRLTEAGWHVVRVWEHDDPVLVADLVEETVRARMH
jgi:DNA mismatch endonuclease, patch repair protein